MKNIFLKITIALLLLTNLVLASSAPIDPISVDKIYSMENKIPYLSKQEEKQALYVEDKTVKKEKKFKDENIKVNYSPEKIISQSSRRINAINPVDD